MLRRLIFRIEWGLCWLAFRIVMTLPECRLWWWALPGAGVWANTSSFAEYEADRRRFMRFPLRIRTQEPDHD